MKNVMNVGEAWLGSYSVTSFKEIAWSRDPVLEASRLKVPGGRGGGGGGQLGIVWVGMCRPDSKLAPRSKKNSPKIDTPF